MRRFPFSAVVGQDDARLALLLAAIDPAIGGVLLRGDKGSAKSTLARGLAAVLPGQAPFVELPVGATEDAVVGSLDLGAAIDGQGIHARPGLLARADGGVLYVDEVNLLPDHLVDVVLDAAASGTHRLERDGVSAEQPARFVLVGSMNPEEGELRPQLLDRFGLVVDVRAPTDPAVRVAAVEARLAFDAGAELAGDDALAERLGSTRPAGFDRAMVDAACRLALAVGAEGLRADLVLCRAAAALAGWEARPMATPEDLERVAPLVLAHRRRRRPFDPPSLPPEELERALAEVAGDAPGSSPPEGRGGPPPATAWGELAGDALDRSPGEVVVPRPTGRGPIGALQRGPVVGDRAPGSAPPTAVAAAATVRASIRRRAGQEGDPGPLITSEDVREPVRRRRAARCVILAVDASGSMGTQERVQAATGAVVGLLGDAYRQRHEVALVAFHGAGAEVVLGPTASVELARARLADLPTGGTTPLAEAVDVAFDVARGVPEGTAPLVVLLTDGRATGGGDALDRALAAARRAAALGIPALVLDAEQGPARLGLASRLADALGAPCLSLGDLTPEAVERALRSAVA